MDTVSRAISFFGRPVALFITCVLSNQPAMSQSVRAVVTVDGPIRDALTMDTAGNLYGETFVQGSNTGGTVFRLSTASSYASYRTLYVFGGGGGDGTSPAGGITITRGGVLLGTTAYGGIYNAGTAFNLGKASATAFAVLHVFSGSPENQEDGAYPMSGLTKGPWNLFYGTTSGSSNIGGTVFYVSSSTIDPKYNVISRFSGEAGGFAIPTHGRLAVDQQGRLFGVTTAGGDNNGGFAFMVQKSGGKWQTQIIKTFGLNASDGIDPTANVVLDKAGNVYGCAQGGNSGQGIIFRLTSTADPNAEWQETVLANFSGRQGPIAASTSLNISPEGQGCGVTIDPDTDVIAGTTYGGGIHDRGTMFTLTPPVAGQVDWTLEKLYDFTDRYGSYPVASPLKVGNEYFVGNTTNGIVYAIAP